MKSLLFLGVGALTGFALVYFLVPTEVSREVPPSWFSLPGRALSVNGVSVDSWEEANLVLHKATKESLTRAQADLESELYGGRFTSKEPGERPPELNMGEFLVEYVPARRASDSATPIPTVVRVRAWLPVTVEYGRTPPGPQFARFEPVPAEPVQ
ncbi:MAG: hypothetical protein KDC95_01225 [Planctomycetes bacterium]|nr:hypothetical protein [Planctomycetota bacterium]